MSHCSYPARDRSGKTFESTMEDALVQGSPSSPGSKRRAVTWPPGSGKRQRKSLDAEAKAAAESAVDADWANLPPNVTEQILGMDGVTYCLGGQVCKNWHQVQQADGCRVLNLDIPYYEDEGCTTDQVIAILEQHASRDLRLLCMRVGDENFDEDALLAMISKYQSLMHLSTACPDITRWSLLDQVSTNLVSLRLECLHIDVMEEWDDHSLETFNHLAYVIVL